MQVILDIFSYLSKMTDFFSSNTFLDTLHLMQKLFYHTWHIFGVLWVHTMKLYIGMAIIEQILESFQTFSVTLGCFLAKLPPSNSHSKLPKYNASTYTHFLHSSYHPQQKPHLHFAQVSIFQCHMGHIHSHFNNCLIFNILHLPTKQSITMGNKQTLHKISKSPLTYFQDSY